MEFSAHQLIIAAFSNLGIFFAQPYKSWQRGLNEHTNGLIREFIPKGTDINSISETTIASIQNKINFRPRTVLHFKSPEEVFLGFYLNIRSVASRY